MRKRRRIKGIVVSEKDGVFTAHFMLSPEIIGSGETALEALSDLRLKSRVYYENAFFIKGRGISDISIRQREALLQSIMNDDERDGLYGESVSTGDDRLRGGGEGVRRWEKDDSLYYDNT